MTQDHSPHSQIDGPSSGVASEAVHLKVFHFVCGSRSWSLWNLHGVSLRVLVFRIFKSVQTDHLFDRAAELGFYFLFALFPALLSASSLLGLAARSADQIYDRLLHYLALVIPSSALGTVLETFNETTAAATPGKLTIGLVVAIWSASVGISAVQDTLNDVYKIQETRSYIKARVYAIGLTVLLSGIVTLILACLLGGDYVARIAGQNVGQTMLRGILATFARGIGWTLAVVLLALAFATIYYWAPDTKQRHWRWFSPGALFGIFGWLVASLGLRTYLYFFNTYSLTYGSLGAVIILLTWFYITGLMLLVGAEVNKEIELTFPFNDAECLKAH